MVVITPTIKRNILIFLMVIAPNKNVDQRCKGRIILNFLIRQKHKFFTFLKPYFYYKNMPF